MYSSKVIESSISRYEEKAGHRLARIELPKTLDWVAHLSEVWDKEEGKWKRDLTKEEKLFIRNERVLSAIDFRYWLKYATIQRDGGGICNAANLWESQEIFLRVVAKLEEEMFDALARNEPVEGILIAFHKARQLGACLGKGTRVLTADLRWVPIEEIKVGDLLVAVDEDRPLRRGVARKMRVATVVNTVNMEVPTYSLNLSDGTKFTATPHHKFLAKSPKSHGWEWIQVQNMEPGYMVRKISSPWSDGRTYEDGWFSGFLDGEGSVRYKASGGGELCGAQIQGPVLDRAIKYLQDNGYKFRFDIDSRKGGDTSKFGNKEVHKVVVSRMHDIFRLLGKTRPSRFIDKPWWPGKELPNNGGESFVTVVSVGKSLILPVYDVETTTGTYIAEGMVSHNTALSRLLCMHRETTAMHLRGMSASVDDDKIMELYDRDKLIIENLPVWLCPEVGYDEKAAHIYFEKLNSRMLYQVATQKSGLGTGRQFDIGHLTECSSWPNPLMIEFDFFPTIPQSYKVLVILESTANGRGDWWHDFTDRVRTGGSRRWRYVFVPWYAEISKYRATPPVNWNPTKVSMLHAQNCYDSSPEFLGKNVMITREQLYWYETTRDEYLKSGKLNFFLTNYCATPEESFQHSGQSAFDPMLIEDLRSTAKQGHAYEIQKAMA